MPPPPPPPPPPLPKLATAPAPIAKKAKKDNAPSKKESVKKAGPPPPPPARDPGTHLMNRGSLSGPETAPKPNRRPSQESVGAPEVAPKPKRQDGRSPSVSSDSRSSSSAGSRPPSVNSRPPSVASRPPSVPKRKSSTQLSDSSPVNDHPSSPMTIPAPPMIPVPPPPPPIPINESVYESIDSIAAERNFQPPPSLANQSNLPANDEEDEEALYDFIPPPAVKPKPKRTSTTSSLHSNTSDVMITKAERDAIRRVSAVITDELLQQDEQLAQASFHPSVGDTEMVDDDVYDDPNGDEGEVYDDIVNANEKAALFRQSASLTTVVPQPPAPPPIPGYGNDEIYDDTFSSNEKAMEYKQHVMPNMNSPPPPDTNAVYEEVAVPAPPPVAPPPPPIPPPLVADTVPPKAPPPPPVVTDQDYDFVPDQDYDFVPDQDYDELPPPKAVVVPPVAPFFAPGQGHGGLPPKAPPPPPVIQPSVPDQDYDELPPPKAAVSNAYEDYDDLPPPRPVATQPTAVEQGSTVYNRLVHATGSQLPPSTSQATVEDQIYDTLPPNDTNVEGDIYDILPPKATQPPTTTNEVDMDYDVLPPVSRVATANYATVQLKNRSAGGKKDAPVKDDDIPELDALGKLVQDAPEENMTFGNGGQDEISTLGSVLNNMGASEDKSSSEEGKWDLPSGEDDEDEGTVYV